MAEKNIKISGIGDVTRADFVRAITDPDKFKEFADQQGWGNKRRQLAWNSLHNYAQGVQNGEINEINDMHQIVDDTGARTNKQEKYNWIGSKFDANGATAAFMNQIAKGMQTATKPADKSLKSIPSITSYLNQQWFGSNNPDWELFQKNDTLTNGVYGIANRSAKIKEGLTKYKNELITNGAQYNWDGVDKDALYKNLDAAIASSNVATYAPLGITSDYINNALATKDLSTTVSDTDSTQTQTTENDPTKGFSEEELARYNTMTPEQQQQYLTQRNAVINLNNEKFLAQNQADIDRANKEKEDTAFKNWLVANGYYSPKAQASSYVPFRLAQSSMVDSKGKRLESPAIKNAKKYDEANKINKFGDQEWDNFIHGDLTSDIHKTYDLKNADRLTTKGTVAIKSKLDWINYNYKWLLDTGKLNNIGDDVSDYVHAPKGTVWRLKNSKRNSDGTYMYMRKRGNNLEFYRSKSWSDLRNNEYKKYISKHQWGGIFGNQAKLREQYSKDLKARQDAIKKQKDLQANSVERTPLRGQRDPNKIKAGQRELGNLDQLTGTDKLQIAGIFADIGSTMSSFAGPAGNLIGAGAGVVGTGLHAAADFNDPSVSKAEAFTNLGANLLFDAAGAVPILGSYGKLAKLGRVGRALQNNARLYKIVLGAVTAPGVIQAAPNAATAVKKLVTKPTTITADELRDLSTAVSIATGMIKVAPNHDKIRTTNPNYGKDVTVHTNKGKQTIPAKDYESIMDKTKNPTMRARNEALAATTKVDGIQFDNGIFHNYAPFARGSFWEGAYGNFFGTKFISRFNNASDPETKYIFRPAKSLKHQNSKTPKPTTNTEQPKPAQNQPTITNNPEKPLQTHNITPEQQKRDIELLRKRFMSDKPLPIDNATRKAYEHYRKRPMTDQEIKDLEAEQQSKRFMRDLYKQQKPQDQIYAERRDALQKDLSERKSLAKDLADAQQEIKQAKANTQFKINLAEGNARAKDLPIPSARVIVTPESVRTQANREFALNWKPIEFKPELKGAARSKKQAMYERLFPPFAERQGTGSAVQHTTRKSLERRRKMQNAVQQEFLERQRKQNAVILSPTESRQGMYQQMFSPVLTNLDNQARAMGLRAKPSRADVKSVKSSEYKQQQKQSRQQKASEVMEAFGNTKSNNTKGHNKNTNLPHKQSNKKKKTSRDNNIKRRQDGGVLYDYEFLKSVHAFKQGGVIKAQGGVKLNNIWAGKNQDYGYNTYLNKYFDNQDVLAWMRTHYVGDDATKQYADYVMKNVNDRNTYGVNNYNNDSTYVANKGINTFNTGYQNAGNTLNYTLFGNNTKDYTDKKGVAYGLINFTRPAKALATGDSYNANPSKAYIDNALGLQTYSRVASLTDPGIKAGGFGDWGKYWKEQGNTGAYYYIAPGDTSGKGQWIPTKDKTLNGYQDFEAAPQETPKKDGSVTTPGIGKKSIFDKGKEYLSKLTSNPGNLYNAVETGKYLLANKATNDIFKIKAPNYVISPKHTSYQVMDNLAQQNAYHSKAAEAMNQTSRPLTSSGQLQTAAQQESMNNANKLYLQGNSERNTWLEGQKEQSYKAGLYNMESAVDTANVNAQQAYKTRMLNEYQDPRDRVRGLATNRQNWINALEKFNVIDPYVERKNAQQQYGLAKAQWDYQNDANVLLAQQRYQQLLRQHQNDLNFNAYDTDEYKKLINAQKEAGARYYNNMYQVYGISNPGFKYKKGGKFEDISKFNTKEFYNTVRHSINTATKQSGDLSKLINTLFKKSNKK